MKWLEMKSKDILFGLIAGILIGATLAGLVAALCFRPPRYQFIPMAQGSVMKVENQTGEAWVMTLDANGGWKRVRSVE